LSARGRADKLATVSRSLYPEIEPYDAGKLRVSELHEIYYEQCGNPRGKPVVFLHGVLGHQSSPRAVQPRAVPANQRPRPVAAVFDRVRGSIISLSCSEQRISGGVWRSG